jgi:hypothetical protein
MAIMHRIAATILGAALLTSTATSAEVAQVQLSYDTYAAGIEVMQMRAFFGLGPWNYHIDLNYTPTLREPERIACQSVRSGFC